ncbi:hypothetical protein Trydic_g4219 [Trypoxylus dichotomus]
MADRCRVPDYFDFQGDVTANWTLWKQKFNFYLLASGKSKESDEIKIALLMNFLGDEGIRIYNTFEFNEGEDRNKLSEILSKFDKYCQPVKNLVFEHYKFFKRNQLQVLGIRDSRIQEKLLQHPNLSLSEAVNIIRSMETSMAMQKEIAREPILVNSVNEHIQESGSNASCNVPDNNIYQEKLNIGEVVSKLGLHTYPSVSYPKNKNKVHMMKKFELRMSSKIILNLQQTSAHVFRAKILKPIQKALIQEVDE